MSGFSQPASQKSSGSFAALLASLTGKDADDTWDDTGLADDVATITYEQALKSHRRVRSSESATELLHNGPTNPIAIPVNAPSRSTSEKKRKSTSITLRLTASEQTQLQERAAAAQLSVSAYIRSCIFEAESLRAQVKEALAQMQSVSLQKTSVGQRPPRNWHRRFFPRWSRGEELKADG